MTVPLSARLLYIKLLQGFIYGLITSPVANRVTSYPVLLLLVMVMVPLDGQLACTSLCPPCSWIGLDAPLQDDRLIFAACNSLFQLITFFRGQKQGFSAEKLRLVAGIIAKLSFLPGDCLIPQLFFYPTMLLTRYYLEWLQKSDCVDYLCCARLKADLSWGRAVWGFSTWCMKWS